VLILDGEGTILEINEGFAHLLDRPLAALIGRSIHTVTATTSGRPWSLNLCKPGRSGDRFEVQLQQPGDASRDLELVASKVSLHGQRLDLWVGRDISARRQSERSAQLRAARILEQNAILARVAASSTAQTGDVAAVAREVSEAVANAFAIDYVSVWLLDSPHGPLRVVDRFELATAGHTTDGLLRQQEYGEELEYLTQANYVATNEPHGDPRTAAYAASHLQPRGITALLDGVIRSGGRSHGVLRFERSGSTSPWEADEIAFVCQLADQLGMAISNHEHQVAEARLRESEDNHRQLFEAESDAIVLIDNATGRLIEANRAACQLYGYTHEELTQLRNVDLSAEPEETHRVTARTTPAPERVVNIPLRWHRKKDGTRVPVEITGRFFVQRGRSVHIAAIRDITERTRVEVELHKSEERYRQLVELSTNVILIHQGGRIVYANPAALTMLRANSLEDLIGKPVLDIVHPDQHAIVARRIRAVDEDHIKPPVLEERIIRLDGTVVDVEVTATPFEFRGEPAVQVIAHDVSARKEMEQRLRHSEKMDAVGQLAGGIAHDFNNQLSAILGFADLLAMQLDSSRLKQYAEGIIAAATRSAELTSQLLAFSRKGRHQPMPVDLHEIVHEVCLILERSIGKKIQIVKDLGAVRSVIVADAAQLQSALLNLGINARDAMPHGGVLTFATALTPCTDPGEQDGSELRNWLELSVTDTGTGIDPSIRQRIFEPFFTTKGPGSGTGLGLAAVYGTLQSHGGTIDVTSEPGRGSTFRICLPLDAVRVPSTLEPAAQQPDSRKASLLVVDDEEAVRTTLAQMLRVLGHDVHACADGFEAIEYYGQHWAHIDLVILDMIMPRLDGPETFARLQAINPHVKVLLSSGYSVEGQADELLTHSSAAFLQKPFRMRELEQVLHQALHADV